MKVPTIVILAAEPPLCTIHVPDFLTLAYIPAGRSVPEELTAGFDWPSDRDEAVDDLVATSWASGDEPLEVRSSRGEVLWSNARYGPLT